MQVLALDERNTKALFRRAQVPLPFPLPFSSLSVSTTTYPPHLTNPTECRASESAQHDSMCLLQAGIGAVFGRLPLLQAYELYRVDTVAACV